jgi:hypothetical protein
MAVLFTLLTVSLVNLLLALTGRSPRLHLFIAGGCLMGLGMMVYPATW